jgi:hypothetical protein
MGVQKKCFWSDRSKMRPKSLPLKTPFWMKNERHAAWERFPQIQNERRAAWERVCGRDGPDWSPQQGPQKTSQTVYFKLFWTFIGGPSKHRSCAHTGPDHPNGNPRRRQKVKKGERLALVYKRQSAKPEKQKKQNFKSWNRRPRIYRKTKRESAKDATR